MEKIFLTLCLCLSVVICGGCKTKTKAATGVVPIRKANHQELLRRADQLRAWGLTSDATEYYQKLSRPSAPEAIRYRAFQSWLEVLEETGRLQKFADVGEEFLQVFPRQGQTIRRKLYDYYALIWAWDKATPVATAILDQDAPHDRGQIVAALNGAKSLASLSLVWQDKFTSAQLKWHCAPSDYYQLDPTRRELEITTLTGSWYHAGQPFHWDGGSCRFACELQVKSIEWVAELRLGIFSPDSGQALCASFGCSGGTGDLQYGLSLQSGTIPVLRYNKLPQYALDCWYVVEVIYLAPLRQACLRLYRREGNILLGEQIVALPQPLVGGSYLIGIPMTPKYAKHPSASAYAWLDNFRLYGQGWSAASPSTQFAHLYHIARLAQQDLPKAIQACDTWLEKHAQDWQTLEMRASLWYHEKKLKNTMQDLQQILLINPSHPNRDFIQKRLAVCQNQEKSNE